MRRRSPWLVKPATPTRRPSSSDPSGRATRPSRSRASSLPATRSSSWRRRCAATGTIWVYGRSERRAPSQGWSHHRTFGSEMRVVHWYPNFLAGGGVANSVLALADAQAAAGAETWIAAFAHDAPIYGPLRPRAGVRIASFAPGRTLRLG